MAFELSVASGENRGSFDPRYTCDGEGISPAIAWSEEPAGTKSLVITMVDPDAPLGTVVHWTVYNIGPGIGSIPEGAGRPGPMSQGMSVGRNMLRRREYMGPCPPGRSEHRYVFTLYSTSLDIRLEEGLKFRRLMERLEGSVLGSCTAVLRYARHR